MCLANFFFILCRFYKKKIKQTIFSLRRQVRQQDLTLLEVLRSDNLIILTLYLLF